EGIGGYRPRFPERPPRSPSHHIRFGQNRTLLPHLAAQIAHRIERQRTADGAGKGAYDSPVLTRLAGREHRAARQLHTALYIDVGAVLLGVRGARQHNIGATGTTVAVMALINHKG